MIRRRRSLVLLLFAASTGCSFTDDPREGGLMSYWFRGEKAYQQRAERMQTMQQRVAADLGFQMRQARELEHQNAIRQQELESRLAAIERIESQLDDLERTASEAPQVSRTVQPEVDAQRVNLNELRADIAQMQPAAASQQKLDRLRTEIASLAARVRLLLETQ